MALPNVIHVRQEEDNDGTKYLVAFGTGIMSAIEDDGPTTIGIYKLVAKRRMRKVPVEVSRR